MEAQCSFEPGSLEYLFQSTLGACFKRPSDFRVEIFIFECGVICEWSISPNLLEVG